MTPRRCGILRPSLKIDRPCYREISDQSSRLSNLFEIFFAGLSANSVQSREEDFQFIRNLLRGTARYWRSTIGRLPESLINASFLGRAQATYWFRSTQTLLTCV